MDRMGGVQGRLQPLERGREARSRRQCGVMRTRCFQITGRLRGTGLECVQKDLLIGGELKDAFDPVEWPSR
jgi:hypothetical protein